jgi:hypothetical protein
MATPKLHPSLLSNGGRNDDHGSESDFADHRLHRMTCIGITGSDSGRVSYGPSTRHVRSTHATSQWCGDERHGKGPTRQRSVLEDSQGRHSLRMVKSR